VTDLRFERPMLDRVLAQAEFMDRVMQATGVNPARITRIELGIEWYEGRFLCIARGDDRKAANDVQPGCSASSRPRLPSA